jgi:hypothetical protein
MMKAARGKISLMQLEGRSTALETTTLAMAAESGTAEPLTKSNAASCAGAARHTARKAH